MLRDVWSEEHWYLTYSQVIPAPWCLKSSKKEKKKFIVQKDNSQLKSDLLLSSFPSKDREVILVLWVGQAGSSHKVSN